MKQQNAELKNKIIEAFQKIDIEIDKIHRYLENKINKKTLSDEDVKKYKNYFTKYQKDLIVFDFYNIDEVFRAIDYLYKRKNELEEEWEFLSVSNMITSYENSISEIYYDLIDKETISERLKIDFLIELLGDDNQTIRCVINDLVDNKITIEQFIYFLGLK
jgi:hypothetical protein